MNFISRIFKNKKVLAYVIPGGSFLFFLLLFLGLKNPSLNILRFPLSLFSLIRRELSGMVFYHRNMVRYAMMDKEVDQLKQKLNALNEIYLENNRLKKLFNFKEDSKYKLVAARVIGRSSDNWAQAVIIDKGKNAGIRKGLVAISELGLLGKVVETSASASKIILVNDLNFGISAIVQRSRQEGLVCGTLASSVTMKYLPKEADIKVGDRIVTSGLNPECPKGIVIGTVAAVGDEFSGLTRYANIKPAVKLLNIDEVLIVIP